MERRTARWAALVGAAALLVAACTSDQGGGSGDDSGAGSAAGDDALVIGFANMETGATAFPGVTDGAETAVEYVNEELGGIGGRQVVLESCDVKNDNQAAQQCGQEFANNDDTSFVATGLMLNGGPFYAALADRPVLGGLPITPADDTPPNASFYFGGSFYDHLAELALEEEPESIAYLHEDEVAANEGEATVREALEGSGIDFTSEVIPVGASDVLPQIRSSGAADAEMVMVLAAEICPVVADALESVGATGDVVAVATCLSPDAVSQAPELYSGWRLVGPTKLPAVGTGVDDDTDTFLDAWETYGPGGEPPTFAEIGWGVVMSAHDALSDLDGEELDSPEAVGDALRAFTGPVPMGTDEIQCPGEEPRPTNCARGVVIYEIADDGTLSLAS